MIVTFMIEAFLALYVAIRFGSGLFKVLVVTILICLASFQFAEFEVCVGPPSMALLWSKLGIAGITLLPALGLHLVSKVMRPSYLVHLGYGIAAAYAVIFAFLPGATAPAACMGNYVLVDLGRGWLNVLYDLYYSLFLAIGMIELILRLVGRVRFRDSLGSRQLVIFTLLGYLSFTAPMAVVGILSVKLREATPSIMCGFALTLALILALFIEPIYDRELGPSRSPAPQLG